MLTIKEFSVFMILRESQDYNLNNQKSNNVRCQAEALEAPQIN